MQNIFKKTCLKKYGVDNPAKSKIIQNKIRKTNLKKYGTVSATSTQETQDKMKQTCFKKYGFTSWAKTNQGRKFHRERRIKQIETQKLKGDPLSPSIGKKERKFLNKLQKYCKYKIIRNINTDGYYPDGLIKELKINIEFDEKQHNEKRIKKHDQIRDKYFKSLGYTIFRIKEKDWFEDKNKVIKMFKKIIHRSKNNAIYNKG